MAGNRRALPWMAAAAVAALLAACDNGPSAVAGKQAAGSQMASAEAPAAPGDAARLDHRKDPVKLVDDTGAWQEAASLTAYKRLAVQDMHLPEGGATLEYTYRRGDTTMHGQNWMMRMGGRLFTVSVLASDSAWSVDRDFLVPACASFHVVTSE